MKMRGCRPTEPLMTRRRRSRRWRHLCHTLPTVAPPLTHALGKTARPDSARLLSAALLVTPGGQQEPPSRLLKLHSTAPDIYGPPLHSCLSAAASLRRRPVRDSPPHSSQHTSRLDLRLAAPPRQPKRPALSPAGRARLALDWRAVPGPHRHSITGGRLVGGAASAAR